MVPNIVACAALLPLGILADRLKSTKTIPMLTLLVMCAGYAFLGSVPALGERCMELFFVSLAFTAGALAIYNAQWQAMFGAAVSLRQRNDVYAFRNQFMFVIGILAPVSYTHLGRHAGADEEDDAGADFVCADGGLLYGFGWGV